MSKVIVFGHSDDLLELEGDICEEIGCYETAVDLLFSDGTMLEAKYSKDGVWEIRIVERGTSKITFEPNQGSDSNNYSDKVTLEGNIDWVYHVQEKQKFKKRIEREGGGKA